MGHPSPSSVHSTHDSNRYKSASDMPQSSHLDSKYALLPMFSPLIFHIPQIYIQKDTLLCSTTTAVLTEWQSHLGATGIADFMLTVAAFSTKREIFFGQKFGPGSLLGFRPLGSVIHSTPGNGYIDLVDFCYRGQKRSPANQR